ncbi:hypothetical protein GH714_031423 [Hevea brasiliensis]|uniref:Uncharacterized protein n=1 Tax=Hevea brasiliensis TaxID=3981 RepID=A0A6A6N8H6_HEVBR|nr:hypothetical protein GH714_031423 [Hevea brasiliensis]
MCKKCPTHVREELQEYMQQKASAKTLDKLPDYEDVEILGDDEDEDDVGTILRGSKGNKGVTGEINLLAAVEALQEANTDTIAPHSVREETKLAFDRKLNAITWMKAALNSDLNPVSDHIKATSIPWKVVGTHRSELIDKENTEKCFWLYYRKLQMP